MGTPFYNSLKANRNWVFLFDHRSGTVTDLLGTRSMAITGSPRLDRTGLDFGATIANRAVIDTNTIILPSGYTLILGYRGPDKQSADAQRFLDNVFYISFGSPNNTFNVGAPFVSTAGSFLSANYRNGFNFVASYNGDTDQKCYVNGNLVDTEVEVPTVVTLTNLTYHTAVANRVIQSGVVKYIGLLDRGLTGVEIVQLQDEMDNKISYPTAVYEIRPPDYPTIKDGAPSFSICCGNTTDQVSGILPTTATAAQRKKDTQMADYLQFTRTSTSKLDYGIQTQNQLNYEFEWDGDVYFDTDAVGQITEIVKIGDSATGVCFGLRKTATEKFQFIYGAELTVDFAYSVPSLGPLHIVLRREWVSGTTYDVKLWVNGSYKEKVTGTYAGTGNASAKTYIGYSGNILNTNYLSGRIYYSNIYPHLRPVEKFQRDPFSKTLMLGWGIRANNTVNTVARDTDSVVTVVTGTATFKVNSGFGTDARLEKFLETTGAGATFYLRGIYNPDGITLYYRTTGTLAWTQGDGTVGVTVAADGKFTMPATTQLLWGTL